MQVKDCKKLLTTNKNQTMELTEKIKQELAKDGLQLRKYPEMIKDFHLKKIILNKIFCFNHLEVEFNKINIIFANNGCGKTYLLRCLDLIGNKVDNNSQAFRMGLYAILSQIINIEEYIELFCKYEKLNNKTQCNNL